MSLTNYRNMLTLLKLFFNLRFTSTVILTLFKSGKVVVIATTSAIHKGFTLVIRHIKEPTLLKLVAVTSRTGKRTDILLWFCIEINWILKFFPALFGKSFPRKTRINLGDLFYQDKESLHGL